MAVIQHTSTELRTLRALSRGDVVSPADSGYDEARAAWNLAADQRPAAVVFPEHESDVAFAVAYARAAGGARVSRGWGAGAPAGPARAGRGRGGAQPPGPAGRDDGLGPDPDEP